MLPIDEIIRIARIVIVSVGGASFIIIALATWLGKIWSDKIYIRTSAKYEKEIETIKNRYTVDLEHLRAEISERRDLLNSLQGMLSSSYIASHERILESIEFLWNNVGRVREFTSSFHILYNIFFPKDYENIPVTNFEKLIPSMTDERFRDKIVSLQKDIENKRLFVGEKLWQLYSIYFAFAMRIAWKIFTEKEQGKVYNWDKDIDGTRDNHMFEVLQGAFTDDELNNIVANDPLRGVPQRIMNSLEIKMLSEMNELIFGRRLVDMSIEQQQRVMSLINSISYKTEKPAN